jgi:hypothetical protein
MADIPPDIIAAVARVLGDHWGGPPDDSDTQLAVQLLTVAAPLLADACATAILAHAERQHPRDPEHVPTAWDRHFSIAARVAAGTFTTRENEHQAVADALNRGAFIACPAPEEGVRLRASRSASRRSAGRGGRPPASR